VPGFYDRVRPFTPEDAEICRRIPANVPEQKARLGLKGLLPGDDPVAVNRALFYEPTMNIQGITGGYTGPGGKTVNPCYAEARIDCRLVYDQDPYDILERVQRYLADQGFDDIEVGGFGVSWPSRTPVDHPFARLVAAAGRETYGQDVVITPTSGGTSPRYVFRNVPEMPIVSLGVSHMNSNQHAPNENIKVEDYFLGLAHIAGIMDRFGQGG
jgi:acetylornithine deacetylase/succinyl-diaminopimelate desuccinylase-like protein